MPLHQSRVITLFSISIFVNQPIVTAHNWESTDDGSAPTPNYTGVIFLVIASTIILLSFFIYYLRERCLFRRGSNLPTWQSTAQTTRGVDPSLLQTFPVFKFSQTAAELRVNVPDDENNNQARREGNNNGNQQECAVCLTTFEEKDELRLLPKCDHVFHKDCVDAWLVDHTTCPNCRADLLSQESVADGKRPIKSGGGWPARTEASSMLVGNRGPQEIMSTAEGPSRSGLGRKDEEEVNRPQSPCQ